MFVIYMNDMRFSNIETTVPALRADTKEELLAFIESQKVETYQDGPWSKSFKKDGLLEWYNTPYDFELQQCIMDVEAEVEKFKAGMLTVPSVGSNG